EHGEDLMFLVDPQSEEQVELLRGGRERGEKYQVVAQFKRQEEIHDTIASGSADHEPFQLNAYTIDATVAKHLDFSATTVIRLTARAAGMRWVRFLLFSDLLVDSVRAADGTADTFYRAKGSPELWVRLGAPTRMGEPFTL